VHDYHELIRHVHIKDCRTTVMDEVIAEGKGLEEALSRGVFCQLGLGDAGIDSVIEALRQYDYHGWLVIEQDQFLRATDTPASIVAAQRANREYLRQFGI
jgi:inosose dehydratase